MALIKLTDEEVQRIKDAAEERNNFAVSKGCKPKYGQADEKTASDHLIGAFGELAAAKYLELEWHPHTGRFDSYDVGEYEVRCTPKPHGALILHPTDKAAIYILAIIIDDNTVDLKGWVHTDEGRKPEYWREYIKDRPAFFVPQRMLVPMNLIFTIKEDTANGR